MSSHPPSPGASGPPPKRKRQQACDTCVASKIRCQDVEVDGCLACRRKDRPCSLAVSMGNGVELLHAAAYGSAPPTQRHSPYEMIAQSESRIAELEARILQLEASIALAAPNHHPRAPPRSIHPPPHSRHIDEEEAHRIVSKEAFFSGCLTFQSLYPDVVARGFYTQAEVDMYFQHFKHIFSTSHFPYPPFMLATTPTPTHPFIIIAVMYFLGADARGQVNMVQVVRECLLATMSGAASVEIVLALFILSHAPQQAPDRDPSTSTPTPLRLVSLAHSIGTGLGLHARAEKVLEQAEVLLDPGWENEMERMQLWAAVCNRLNLLRITNAVSSDSVPMIGSRLPKSTLSHVQACTAHLQAAESFLRRCSEAAVMIRELESAVTLEPSNGNAFDARWRDVIDSVFSLSDPAPSPSTTVDRPLLQRRLVHDALCCRFILETRAAVVAQGLPSPLLDIKRMMYSCIATVSKTALRLLELFEQDNVSACEPHSLASTAIASIAVRNFVAVVTRITPMTPPGVDLNLVSRVELALRAMPGAHVRLLDTVSEALEWRRGEFVNSGEAELEGFDFTGLMDPNFLPWDLSLLFPDGLPPIANGM